MRAQLVCHPDGKPGGIDGIVVEIAHDMVRFTVSGMLDDIVLPPATVTGRQDGLWRHTCFEVFCGDPKREYREVNLSPSGAWAAYAFDGYRAGMRELDVDQAPAIVVASGDDLIISAALSPFGFGISGPRGTALGLSAVLEHRDGHLSYWALAHPPGKPDFHHPACFAAELPAPRAP